MNNTATWMKMVQLGVPLEQKLLEINCKIEGQKENMESNEWYDKRSSHTGFQAIILWMVAVRHEDQKMSSSCKDEDSEFLFNGGNSRNHLQRNYISNKTSKLKIQTLMNHSGYNIKQSCWLFHYMEPPPTSSLMVSLLVQRVTNVILEDKDYLKHKGLLWVNLEQG
ncbi:hypothetical protein O6P43_032306 [Quillaja saponaria]|uniref:Uncharacterized protein n=1 Tax=Quillaja saponaria TaxID=32244 RepID=A0AAD7KND9_QUISA|nr:hypothetical protein O6P43_032306 [Quillaja saponaria]